MAKRPWVCIANRGNCPREYLTIVGLSTKRERMGDRTQGGWFGSGTKIAPIAAMKLGMAIYVSSNDRKGRYRLTYRAGGEEKNEDGVDTRQVVLKYDQTHNGGLEVLTHFSPNAFMNWSKPIGDDPLKEFRVWREYFRNAKDADPEKGPLIQEYDELRYANDGFTCVFLPKTDEYVRMMANVNRYFKYLSKDAPVFEIPEIGQAYPKSESGATRLFSLGTMAFCSRGTNLSTLLDYSFDLKTLMSEERTFEDLSRVCRQMGLLLSSCEDEKFLRALLVGMIDGRANLEALALSYVHSSDYEESELAGGLEARLTGRAMGLRAGREAWRRAWQAQFGARAVISTGGYEDRVAETTYGRKAVTIDSDTLRGYLVMIGIPTARQIAQVTDADGCEEVAVTREESERVERIRLALVKDYPGTADWKVVAFEPRTEKAKGTLGLTLFKERKVLMRRDLWADSVDSSDTLVHEWRHVRTGYKDGTVEFIDQADKDEGRRFRTQHGIEDDRSETKKLLADIRELNQRGSSK